MIKKIRKYLTVIITIALVLGGNLQIASAASNHLLIINSKKNTMGYYVNYKLVKEFRVSTGKTKEPTPQGKTKIVNKIKNRPYYKWGIPGGSPKNPLGDRWLGLHLNGTYGTTYAIHGNNNENSIGKNITEGCVRMHNKEVRWLFDQVPKGTDVIIKYTDESNAQIAAKYNINLNQPSKPNPPKPPINTGWKVESGKTYYVKSDGTYQKNGWLKVNNKMYYFDGSGIMQTGWKVINNNKYYLNADGSMAVGPQVINNQTYYFDANGVMKTGWQIAPNGDKYYLNPDGSARIGWQDIDGKKYYFNPDGTSQMGWEKIDGNMYYFNDDGSVKTGWKELLGNSYYFDDMGVMQIGFKDIDGNKYYFYENGVMARDTLLENGNTVDQNGVVTVQ